MGFSSATPEPEPIHDLMNEGQGFGYFTYTLAPRVKLSLLTGFTVDNSQFPNRAGMPALYQLQGVDAAAYPSTAINSSLAERDYLAVLALNGSVGGNFSYQLAYSTHYNSQQCFPDPIGDLIYEGTSSEVFDRDFANTMEGDVTWHLGSSHVLGAGFYVGGYDALMTDFSLVFKVNSAGMQSGQTPMGLSQSARGLNLLYGVYLQDAWQFARGLTLNYGLRWDKMTGFTQASQVSPTLNLLYELGPKTRVHAGFARYFQVANFQGISPTAFSTFAGTSAGLGVPGAPLPVAERDLYWDAGLVHRFTPRLVLTQDNYFRLDQNYLDEGDFGFVPISVPFNYVHGYGWGTENSLSYNLDNLALRLNFVVAREEDKGVATGLFNFSAAELAYMDSHYFILDHTPLLGSSGGVAYRWGRYLFTLDGLFSSGLRGGFANTVQLPIVWQLDLAAARKFTMPQLGEVEDRVVLINIFDRTNLIRPPTGIGVFQSAYGPRLAVYNGLTLPLRPF